MTFDDDFVSKSHRQDRINEIEAAVNAIEGLADEIRTRKGPLKMDDLRWLIGIARARPGAWNTFTDAPFPVRYDGITIVYPKVGEWEAGRFYAIYMESETYGRMTPIDVGRDQLGDTPLKRTP